MAKTRIVAALFALFVPVLAWAQQVEVVGIRMWPAPESTRVVFDVSSPLEHTLFTLENPDRIVIDIEDAKLSTPLKGLDFKGSLLHRMRAARRNGDDLRVVFDVKQAVRPKSFVLRPNKEYGHRLVIDLEQMGGQPKVVKKPAGDRLREIIVAIDAGHGGEDPGASGPRGTREKDVVLGIARRLDALVDKESGMRGVMIRDGDYFISLNDRVRKARKYQADLFVSIHADAFRDHRARGSSVYTLSRSGASSEHARLLAAKENESDLVGGVSLDDKDDLLASVLLDLSQTAAMEVSTEVAGKVLGRLGNVRHLHKRDVERAGFRVLKSPDVPSILVETAFISNPTEERQLRSSSHQYAVARAILDGIKGHFRDNPPVGTLWASRPQTHTISRGDTLAGIARRYHVPLDQLRNVNSLRDDRIQVGETLRIPFASGS